MIIRKLKENEISAALELAWEVFLKYEAPDYTETGAEEFRKSIDDGGFVGALSFYGAFDGDILAGVAATRGDSHIALLFVDGKFHRQGVGTRLFKAVAENTSSPKITVNSSPFAVPVYHKWGFKNTSEEQSVNGLRFIPMEFNRNNI